MILFPQVANHFQQLYPVFFWQNWSDPGYDSYAEVDKSSS